jgi:site-specific DNA-adenine methylase
MKQSEPFTAMAEKIERNPEFGGAVVIVPPGNELPMQWLIVDADSDILRFWVKLKTDIDAVIARLDEVARNQQAFRMR